MSKLSKKGLKTLRKQREEKIEELIEVNEAISLIEKADRLIFRWKPQGKNKVKYGHLCFTQRGQGKKFLRLISSALDKVVEAKRHEQRLVALATDFLGWLPGYKIGVYEMFHGLAYEGTGEDLLEKEEIEVLQLCQQVSTLMHSIIDILKMIQCSSLAHDKEIVFGGQWALFKTGRETIPTSKFEESFEELKRLKKGVIEFFAMQKKYEFTPQS